MPALPYHSPVELARIAKDFLNNYHPELKLPIPIEEIVELKMGINVIAVPNLQKNYDIDAYITSDFSTIVIDEYCYTHYPYRARFTYAHEVAHIILHQEYYSQLGISNLEDYLLFQNSLIKKENATLNKTLELQAHGLAAYILMPQEQFNLAVDELIPEEMTIEDLSTQDMNQLGRILAEKFYVSDTAVQKHLLKEYPVLKKNILY